MEVPASAGTVKFPYLEDIFEFSSVLRVTFLKTCMPDGPRYALCGHTVVMIQYGVVLHRRISRGVALPKSKYKPLQEIKCEWIVLSTYT